MKKIFIWKSELIDLDIYEEMRVSEKHRKLSENYRYNIIKLSPFDFSHK